MRTTEIVTAHVRRITHERAAIKIIVTFGIATATIFALMGAETPAFAASVLTNLVWIWE